MEYINLPKSSGVYCIKNTETGACYVGSSVNVHRRIYEHKRQLEKGEHHSIYLQRSWDAYGRDSFTSSLLELVEDLSVILKREQFYIDTLNSSYNMLRTAGSNFGKVISPEQLAVMSENAKKQWQCPIFRANYSSVRAKMYAETDLAEVQSQTAIRRYQEHPEHAENHSIIMKDKWANSDYRYKMSIARTLANSKPEFREKQSKVKLELCSTPEYRKSKQLLDDCQAIFVIVRRRFGDSAKAIADMLDVKVSLIKDLLYGRTYTHIDRETLQIDWSKVSKGSDRKHKQK